MTDTRLITTGLDESCASQDMINIMILGEWCVATHSSNDFPVAPYHWKDRSKYNDDSAYINGVYERFLPLLAASLNDAHNSTLSVRYWRILAGPWLLFYIQAIFDRWESIRCVVDQGSFYSEVSDDDVLKFLSRDTWDFVDISRQDEWNHIVFREVMKKFRSIKLNPVFKPLDHNCFQRTKNSKIKNIFSDYMFKMLSIASRFFIWPGRALVFRAPNFFLKNRSRSLFDRIIWRLQDYLYNHMSLLSDKGPSDWRYQDLTWHTENSVEEFMVEMLPQFIPNAFLEDFKIIAERAKNSSYPQKPSKILTSNSVYFNEMFKFWCAAQVERGTPLFIYQHGGGYGAQKIFSNESHELEIADKFISWGWSKHGSNVEPFGYYRPTRQRKANNNNDQVLVVMTGLPRYSHKLCSEPQSGNFKSYLTDQEVFLKLLNKKIRRNIIIRSPQEDYGWNTKKRIGLIENIDMIDDGVQDINLLYISSRVVIHSNNSTTFIETMANDIPTLLFLNPKHFEIRKEAEEVYKSLSDAEILHYTPESLSLFLNKNINKIDEWWMSETTRSAVSKFTRMFCMDEKGKILQ